MQLLTLFFCLFAATTFAQTLPSPTDTCNFCMFENHYLGSLNIRPAINLYCIHPDINCHIKTIKHVHLKAVLANQNYEENYIFKRSAIAGADANGKNFNLMAYYGQNCSLIFTDIWAETQEGKMIKLDDFIIHSTEKNSFHIRPVKLNDSLSYYPRYQRHWLRIKDTHPQLMGKSSEHIHIVSFQLDKVLIKSDKFDASMYGRNRCVSHIKAFYKKEPIELPDYELK